MRKPQNKFKSWTPEQDTELLALVSANKPVTRIAKIMGRTVFAIQKRANRIAPTRLLKPRTTDKLVAKAIVEASTIISTPRRKYTKKTSSAETSIISKDLNSTLDLNAIVTHLKSQGVKSLTVSFTV